MIFFSFFPKIWHVSVQRRENSCEKRTQNKMRFAMDLREWYPSKQPFEVLESFIPAERGRGGPLADSISKVFSALGGFVYATFYVAFERNGSGEERLMLWRREELSLILKKNRFWRYGLNLLFLHIFPSSLRVCRVHHNIFIFSVFGSHHGRPCADPFKIWR